MHMDLARADQCRMKTWAEHWKLHNNLVLFNHASFT